MMRSETLDITITGQAGDLWFVLSGPFTQEQVPTVREKILTLIDDGSRSFVVDMEGVTFIDPGVPQLFLQLLNTVKGKNGTFKLVFNNDCVSRAFHPYRHLFSIFPDAELLRRGGLVYLLLKQRRFLLRKTGIRLSRPVAFFLLIVLCGWFLSLAFIIHLQNRHIREQQHELQELTEWETRSRLEIDNLRSRLQPLEQLGILRDTVRGP
ncbi:MAG: STAS domain-containing protein [Chitinispirillaceae bacterium]|nr:STAS domain-containing protein [Chitinispirillaceae bacterium]